MISWQIDCFFSFVLNTDSIFNWRVRKFSVETRNPCHSVKKLWRDEFGNSFIGHVLCSGWPWCEFWCLQDSLLYRQSTNKDVSPMISVQFCCQIKIQRWIAGACNGISLIHFTATWCRISGSFFLKLLGCWCCTSRSFSLKSLGCTCQAWVTCFVVPYGIEQVNICVKLTLEILKTLILVYAFDMP